MARLTEPNRSYIYKVQGWMQVMSYDILLGPLSFEQGPLQPPPQKHRNPIYRKDQSPPKIL